MRVDELSARHAPIRTEAEFEDVGLATDTELTDRLFVVLSQYSHLKRHGTAGRLAIVNLAWCILNKMPSMSDIQDGTYYVRGQIIKLHTEKTQYNPRQILSVGRAFEGSVVFGERAYYGGAVHTMLGVSFSKADRALFEECLAAIREDASAACSAYGFHSGRCGICGRVLSDPESVKRGIGPDCAVKYGWK
jgi:hypothetical protein